MLPVAHSASGESCVDVCVTAGSLFVHANVVPCACDATAGSKPAVLETIEIEKVAASAGSATPSTSTHAIRVVVPNLANLMGLSSLVGGDRPPLGLRPIPASGSGRDERPRAPPLTWVS